MVEPLLWRRLGWCRLELDLAGRQQKKGENRAESKRLRAVLPVGSRAVAEELLDRLLPDRPREQSRPPRRAWWKSPLRYRWLAWGRTETCVVATSGRLRRVTCWVPLEKVQSFRRIQGPAQRRLRLASLHLDTAGRSLHATLRDRDLAEADAALVELRDLARQGATSRGDGAGEVGAGLVAGAAARFVGIEGTDLNGRSFVWSGPPVEQALRQASPGRRSGGRRPRACRRTPRHRAASASRRTARRGSPARGRRRPRARRARRAPRSPRRSRVEELHFVDADGVVPAGEPQHLCRRGCRDRPHLRARVGDDVADVVAVVDHRLHDQRPLPRDLGAAKAPDQLLALAREHRAADDLEPSAAMGLDPDHGRET